MVCVRPGVLLKKARRLRPARALIALDLPTFERPAKATSGPASGGKSAGFAAEVRNRACRNADKGPMVCPNGGGALFSLLRGISNKIVAFHRNIQGAAAWFDSWLMPRASPR